MDTRTSETAESDVAKRATLQRGKRFLTCMTGLLGIHQDLVFVKQLPTNIENYNKTKSSKN
jgi:hypothetical protein